VAVAVDEDGGAVGDASREEGFGEGILEVAQDGAADGAGAEGGLVAELDEEGFGGVGDLEVDFAVGEQALDLGELEVGDAQEVVARQGTEDEDFVDAVQELGAEEAPQLV